MRCPFCQSEDSQVKDSRPTDDNSAIRRRRICSACGGRFTTFERIQLREMSVIKSDGKVQSFDRDKISRSMRVALQKRPITLEMIEQATNGIVRQLESEGENEIPASHIGDLVMAALVHLDIVGYIRFVSVYKDFRNPEDFATFLKEVQTLQEENASNTSLENIAQGME